ncbi:peroxiredoxin [Pedobacter sp. UYP30]|uniref:AhpC/TSA family protein n=1 Tax=Pedobacter sp. UYP30 TaxID=1756400 RepID=UPI003396E5DD
MKYICLLFVFQFVVLTATHSQQNEQSRFFISGKILGRDTGTLTLSYLNKNQKFNTERAKIEDGKFSFSGAISEATMAYLIGNITTRSMDDPNRTVIFLEPRKMEMELVEGKFSEVLLTGSKTQQGYTIYISSQFPYTVKHSLIANRIDSLDKLIKINESTGSLKKEVADSEFEWRQNNNNSDSVKINFMLENPGSVVSAYLLPFFIDTRKIALDSAVSIFNSFSQKVKDSALGKNVKSLIADRKAATMGNIAPQFRAKDINGKIISSEQYQGEKYLLLDFWASWCGPCHDQAPYLNKLYDKYKEKGLEIISVSADRDRNIWKKAIIKDKIERLDHMLIMDDIATPGAEKMDVRFSVGVYPVLLVIDKEGVIEYRIDGFGGAEEFKKIDDLLAKGLN